MIRELNDSLVDSIIQPRPEQLKTNFVKNYLHFDCFPFLETGLIETGELPGELSRQMGFSLHRALDLDHFIWIKSYCACAI